MDYRIHEDTLTDIADAIRQKKGTEEPISVSDFSSEILSIPAGGGENPVEYLTGYSDNILNYTVSSTGRYLLINSTADGRQNTITLPSGRTPIVSHDCSGNGSKIRIVDLVAGDTVNFACYTYQSYNKGIGIFKMNANVTELTKYDAWKGGPGVTNISNTGTDDTVLVMFVVTDGSYAVGWDRSTFDSLDTIYGAFGTKVYAKFKCGVDKDMKTASIYTTHSQSFVERYIFRVE